jgi:hypothetical protein
MHREWKSAADAAGEDQKNRVEVVIEIDQDIVHTFRSRWPQNWREQMATHLTASAKKL